MPRRLTALWLGLSLVSCDKPGSPEAPNGESPSAEPLPRRKYAPREHAPDQPAALRAPFEAAEKLESPVEREKAFAAIAWDAVEIDPETAHEAFRRLPADSAEKIRLIQYYAMRLAERNPDEALEWAASLGSDREIAAAIGQIALEIAESDPLRAANLLSESGIAGRDFDVAVVQVIQRWAATSAPDAAAWVSSFPPGKAREAGVIIIAGRWLESDASAAFSWLEGIKDAELRSETARAMEGIILQQPQDIRDAWLQYANPRIRSELEEQRAQAIKEVGDNIPPPQE